MIDRFDGRYAFLSNFYPAPVQYDGGWYATVEHAYQAAKSDDPNYRHRIGSVISAGQAKRLGRLVTLRFDWPMVKDSVMQELVRAKFQSMPLRQMLLDTGDEQLVEGNTWGDRYWGVDSQTREGENRLGRILMWAREVIQAENDLRAVSVRRAEHERPAKHMGRHTIPE